MPTRSAHDDAHLLDRWEPKAGTTSLYYYRKQHPQIYMSPVKEPGFFDYGPERARFCGPGDQALYRDTVSDLGSYQRLFQSARDEPAIGKASAYYLYSPAAADRISSVLPRAKLVTILRHPAERAFSAFLHNLSDGREPLTDFGQALQEEPGRLRRGFSPLWYSASGRPLHRRRPAGVVHAEALGPSRGLDWGRMETTGSARGTPRRQR